MHINRWLELKRTKAACLGLAVVFTCQPTAAGADAHTFQLLQHSSEQQRQLDLVHTASILTIYDDLYGRIPTDKELREALDFLHRAPQWASLVERLSQSPDSRWRLRQLNPERIAQRKQEAVRIAQAVSRMVGEFLRELQATGDRRQTASDKLQAEGFRLGEKADGRRQTAENNEVEGARLNDEPASWRDTNQFRSTSETRPQGTAQELQRTSQSSLFLESSSSDQITTAMTSTVAAADQTTILSNVESFSSTSLVTSPPTSSSPPVDSVRATNRLRPPDQNRFASIASTISQAQRPVNHDTSPSGIVHSPQSPPKADPPLADIVHRQGSAIQHLENPQVAIHVAPNLTIQPDAGILAGLNEHAIRDIEAWLADPQTLCSNCAPNALAPLLGMVGVTVSRETLTAQAFLVEYLSGNLKLGSEGGREGVREGVSSAKEKPEVTDLSHSLLTYSLTHYSSPLVISMDTVQRLAQGYGLTLQAVQLTPEELLQLRGPLIAALDLTQDGQADHYVVVTDVNDTRVAYRESDGSREVLPTGSFLRLFTGFALVVSPESAGRVLSQGQARSITGGKKDYWGEYPNLDELFKGPDLGGELKGLGITFGTIIVTQGLLPSTFSGITDFTGATSSGWGSGFASWVGSSSAVSSSLAQGVTSTLIAYQVGQVTSSLAYQTLRNDLNKIPSDPGYDKRDVDRAQQNLSLMIGTLTPALSGGITALTSSFSPYGGSISQLAPLERFTVGTAAGLMSGGVSSILERNGWGTAAPLIGTLSAQFLTAGLTNAFKDTINQSTTTPPGPIEQWAHDTGTFTEGLWNHANRNWDKILLGVANVGLFELAKDKVGPEYAQLVAAGGNFLLSPIVEWKKDQDFKRSQLETTPYSIDTIRHKLYGRAPIRDAGPEFAGETATQKLGEVDWTSEQLNERVKQFGTLEKAALVSLQGDHPYVPSLADGLMAVPISSETRQWSSKTSYDKGESPTKTSFFDAEGNSLNLSAQRLPNSATIKSAEVSRAYLPPEVQERLREGVNTVTLVRPATTVNQTVDGFPEISGFPDADTVQALRPLKLNITPETLRNSPGIDKLAGENLHGWDIQFKQPEAQGYTNMTYGVDDLLKGSTAPRQWARYDEANRFVNGRLADGSAIYRSSLFPELNLPKDATLIFNPTGTIDVAKPGMLTGAAGRVLSYGVSTYNSLDDVAQDRVARSQVAGKNGAMVQTDLPDPTRIEPGKSIPAGAQLISPADSVKESVAQTMYYGRGLYADPLKETGYFDPGRYAQPISQDQLKGMKFVQNSSFGSYVLESYVKGLPNFIFQQGLDRAMLEYGKLRNMYRMKEEHGETTREIKHPDVNIELMTIGSALKVAGANFLGEQQSNGLMGDVSLAEQFLHSYVETAMNTVTGRYKVYDTLMKEGSLSPQEAEFAYMMDQGRRATVFAGSILRAGLQHEGLGFGTGLTRLYTLQYAPAQASADLYRAFTADRPYSDQIAGRIAGPKGVRIQEGGEFTTIPANQRIPNTAVVLPEDQENMAYVNGSFHNPLAKLLDTGYAGLIGGRVAGKDGAIVQTDLPGPTRIAAGELIPAGAQLISPADSAIRSPLTDISIPHYRQYLEDHPPGVPGIANTFNPQTGQVVFAEFNRPTPVARFYEVEDAFNRVTTQWFDAPRRQQGWELATQQGRELTDLEKREKTRDVQEKLHAIQAAYETNQESRVLIAADLLAKSNGLRPDQVVIIRAFGDESVLSDPSTSLTTEQLKQVQNLTAFYLSGMPVRRDLNPMQFEAIANFGRQFVEWMRPSVPEARSYPGLDEGLPMPIAFKTMDPLVLQPEDNVKGLRVIPVPTQIEGSREKIFDQVNVLKSLGPRVTAIGEFLGTDQFSLHTILNKLDQKPLKTDVAQPPLRAASLLSPKPPVLTEKEREALDKAFGTVVDKVVGMSEGKSKVIDITTLPGEVEALKWTSTPEEAQRRLDALQAQWDYALDPAPLVMEQAFNRVSVRIGQVRAKQEKEELEAETNAKKAIDGFRAKLADSVPSVDLTRIAPLSQAVDLSKLPEDLRKEFEPSRDTYGTSALDFRSDLTGRQQFEHRMRTVEQLKGLDRVEGDTRVLRINSLVANESTHTNVGDDSYLISFFNGVTPLAALSLKPSWLQRGRLDSFSSGASLPTSSSLDQRSPTPAYSSTPFSSGVKEPFQYWSAQMQVRLTPYEVEHLTADRLEPFLRAFNVDPALMPIIGASPMYGSFFNTLQTKNQAFFWRHLGELAVLPSLLDREDGVLNELRQSAQDGTTYDKLRNSKGKEELEKIEGYLARTGRFEFLKGQAAANASPADPDDWYNASDSYAPPLLKLALESEQGRQLIIQSVDDTRVKAQDYNDRLTGGYREVLGVLSTEMKKKDEVPVTSLTLIGNDLNGKTIFGLNMPTGFVQRTSSRIPGLGAGTFSASLELPDSKVIPGSVAGPLSKVTRAMGRELGGFNERLSAGVAPYEGGMFLTPDYTSGAVQALSASKSEVLAAQPFNLYPLAAPADFTVILRNGDINAMREGKYPLNTISLVGRFPLDFLNQQFGPGSPSFTGEINLTDVGSGSPVFEPAFALLKRTFGENAFKQSNVSIQQMWLRPETVVSPTEVMGAVQVLDDSGHVKLVKDRQLLERAMGLLDHQVLEFSATGATKRSSGFLDLNDSRALVSTVTETDSQIRWNYNQDGELLSDKKLAEETMKRLRDKDALRERQETASATSQPMQEFQATLDSRRGAASSGVTLLPPEERARFVAWGMLPDSLGVVRQPTQSVRLLSADALGGAPSPAGAPSLNDLLTVEEGLVQKEQELLSQGVDPRDVNTKLAAERQAAFQTLGITTEQQPMQELQVVPAGGYRIGRRGAQISDSEDALVKLREQLHTATPEAWKSALREARNPLSEPAETGATLPQITQKTEPPPLAAVHTEPLPEDNFQKSPLNTSTVFTTLTKELALRPEPHPLDGRFQQMINAEWLANGGDPTRIPIGHVVAGNEKNAFATEGEDRRLHLAVNEGVLTAMGGIDARGLERVPGILLHEAGHHFKGHTDPIGESFWSNVAFGVLGQLSRTQQAASPAAMLQDGLGIQLAERYASRLHERAADETAMKVLRERADLYQLDNMQSFFKVLKAEELDIPVISALSTHPLHDERIETIDAVMKSMSPGGEAGAVPPAMRSVVPSGTAPGHLGEGLPLSMSEMAPRQSLSDLVSTLYSLEIFHPAFSWDTPLDAMRSPQFSIAAGEFPDPMSLPGQTDWAHLPGSTTDVTGPAGAPSQAQIGGEESERQSEQAMEGRERKEEFESSAQTEESTQTQEAERRLAENQQFMSVSSPSPHSLHDGGLPDLPRSSPADMVVASPEPFSLDGATLAHGRGGSIPVHEDLPGPSPDTSPSPAGLAQMPSLGNLNSGRFLLNKFSEDISIVQSTPASLYDAAYPLANLHSAYVLSSGSRGVESSSLLDEANALGDVTGSGLSTNAPAFHEVLHQRGFEIVSDSVPILIMREGEVVAAYSAPVWASKTNPSDTFREIAIQPGAGDEALIPLRDHKLGPGYDRHIVNVPEDMGGLGAAVYEVETFDVDQSVWVNIFRIQEWRRLDIQSERLDESGPLKYASVTPERTSEFSKDVSPAQLFGLVGDSLNARIQEWGCPWCGVGKIGGDTVESGVMLNSYGVYGQGDGIQNLPAPFSLVGSWDRFAEEEQPIVHSP